MGVIVWIGLNHLEERAGWQWSDGAPLTLVNFIAGDVHPSQPIGGLEDCGTADLALLASLSISVLFKIFQMTHNTYVIVK